MAFLRSYSQKLFAGKLHFVKFETAKIDSAMSFIRENCLHMSHRGDDEITDVVRIKATGGGAFKFSDVFQVSDSNKLPRVRH